MRRSAMPNPVAAPAWAAAVLLCAAGCTICPDPFDYSGPVPDGSAPQNDFRARANGIANPTSHPVPWPPVVRAAPRSGDESREITVVAEAVGEAPADASGADAPLDAAPDVMPATAETTGAADTVAEEPVLEESVIEEILPPPAAVRPETLPRLRETPGWRPRG